MLSKIRTRMFKGRMLASETMLAVLKSTVIIQMSKESKTETKGCKKERKAGVSELPQK